MFSQEIIITGLLVFFARICDVSIGTVRVITTIQGRTAIAFCLAFFEIIIWLTVASTVINQISEKPLLVIFYALGFATGNVVGILVERRLAFGMKVLRIITPEKGNEIAAYLREKGQPVTIYQGEGLHGPVYELYIACQRKDLKWILPEVRLLDPKMFYVIEQARNVSKIYKSTRTSLDGRRGTNK